MKKKFFIGLFIVAAIGLFIFAHLALKHNKSYEPQQNIQAPIEIPSESIVRDLSSIGEDKASVVMFYVDWCTYCRRFMPTFGEFAEKYKDSYNFVVVNCDLPENTDVVKQYHIMGFPTVFIFDKKVNHKFALNMAATADPMVFTEELDNYLNVRKNFNFNNK